MYCLNSEIFGVVDQKLLENGILEGGASRNSPGKTMEFHLIKAICTIYGDQTLTKAFMFEHIVQ